jgi:hypothetical protein
MPELKSKMEKINGMLLKALAEPGETAAQAEARIQKNFELACRMAEVEECLAWNALYGTPIPRDVTDGEISGAVDRFRKDMIFRLDHSGHASHGRSFTESARPAVLAKARVENAFENARGADLSRSAALAAVFETAPHTKYRPGEAGDFRA